MLAILTRMTFAVAIIFAIESSAVSADVNEDVATRLLRDVEKSVRSLKTIPNEDELLSEWAIQQDLFSELSESEALLDRYDEALEFVGRIDRDDSRSDTLQNVAYFAAVNGDFDEVDRILSRIPNAARPAEKSGWIFSLVDRLAVDGHQSAALTLLRRYEPLMERQQVGHVYSSLAARARTHEDALDFAKETDDRLAPEGQNSESTRSLYMAFLAAGRSNDAVNVARGRFDRRSRDDAADSLALLLAKACRRDEAIAIAAGLTVDASMTDWSSTWWPDHVLKELHMRGAIRADDIEAMLSKVQRDHARDEILYYGSLAALKEREPRLIARCAERASDPWSYTRIVCHCLVQGNDQSSAIIEALGGEARILAEAGRAGKNCRAAAVASLAIALARSGREETARDYFDVAAAQFRLMLNDHEVNWEDRSLDDPDLPESWQYFAKASVVLEMQPTVQEVLRAREDLFNKNRYKIGSFFYQLELSELIPIAETWLELNALDEVERLCRHENRQYRCAIVSNIIEKRVTPDNVQDWIDLIDRIETAEWNALMKLELIKTLSKPEPACNE